MAQSFVNMVQPLLDLYKAKMKEADDIRKV